MTEMDPAGESRQIACFRLGSRIVGVLAHCHGRLPCQNHQGSVRVGEDEFPIVDVVARIGLAASDPATDLVLVEEDGTRAALKVVGPARLARIDPEKLHAVPNVYPAGERAFWAGLWPTERGELLPLLSLSGVVGGQ